MRSTGALELSVTARSNFVGYPTDNLPRRLVYTCVISMRGETGELWRKLCEQAAVEQDPEKLLELTREINRLLDEKEARLKREKGTV